MRLMPGLPRPLWPLAGCAHRCGSARVWVSQRSWVSTKPSSSPLYCMPARPRLSTRGTQRNSIVFISTAFANCWKWSGRTKCPTQRFSSRQECPVSSPCSASHNSAGLDMSPGCLMNDYPSTFSTENCRLECQSCPVMEARSNASRTHVQSLHEGLWSGSQLMGDTCTGSVSMAQCNLQKSCSIWATTHRDCQDKASSLEGPLHQPFSTGPCSVVLPSLCQSFPGSDWPHQQPSNPPSPIGWMISEDGHLSPREDEHHHLGYLYAALKLNTFQLSIINNSKLS